MWQIIALIHSTVQLTGWRYIHSCHSQGKGQIRIFIAGGIVHLYCYLRVSEMFLYWLRAPDGSCKNRGCCQISRPPDMHEGSPTVKPGQPSGSKLHMSKMLLVFCPGESFLFSSSAFRHLNDWKQKHFLKWKIIHSLNWTSGICLLSTLILFM